MKKINYTIKPVLKLSIQDMSADIKIRGFILYRKKKFHITTSKAFSGPKVDFEYFENINKNMYRILDQISNKLVFDICKIINDDFPFFKNEYTGEIEINEEESSSNN